MAAEGLFVRCIAPCFDPLPSSAVARFNPGASGSRGDPFQRASTFFSCGFCLRRPSVADEAPSGTVSSRLLFDCHRWRYDTQFCETAKQDGFGRGFGPETGPRESVSDDHSMALDLPAERGAGKLDSWLEKSIDTSFHSQFSGFFSILLRVEGRLPLGVRPLTFRRTASPRRSSPAGKPGLSPRRPSPARKPWTTP